MAKQWMGRVAACSLGLAMLLSTGTALAQQAPQQAKPPHLSSSADQDARLHFEAGASHYEAGDYKLALQEFQTAYEISKRPELYYNMSLCYQQLADYANAITYLKRYLDQVANAPNRTNLERRLVNLQERLDAQKQQEQKEKKEQQELQQEQQQQHEEQNQPATGTQQGQSSQGSGYANDNLARPVAPAAQSQKGVPAAAWIGWSIGAGGIVAGGILGGMALAEKSNVESLPCASTKTCSSSQVHKMNTLAHLSDVFLWGVGGGGLVAGTVLFFVLRGHESAESQTAAKLDVTPWVGATGGGVVAQGRF